MSQRKLLEDIPRVIAALPMIFLVAFNKPAQSSRQKICQRQFL
jgi:hypothetical protein